MHFSVRGESNSLLSYLLTVTGVVGVTEPCDGVCWIQAPDTFLGSGLGKSKEQQDIYMGRESKKKKQLHP